MTSNIKSNAHLQEYLFVLDSGHEIGSHTVNHKVLPELTQPDIEYQVCQSAIDIINQFGFNPTTFAHPERKMNEMVDSILLSHYLATRFSSIVKYPKRKVHSVIRKDNLESLRSEFESFICDDKYEWIVYSGHGLSSSTLNSIDVYEPLDSLAFDSFLSYITTHYRDYTYIATYEEIMMYQFLKDKIRLKYGNGCIGIDKSEVESVLDYYEHPKALISLVFDSDSMVFKSNALVDMVRKKGETIVTLDIRKGTVLYYE